MHFYKRLVICQSPKPHSRITGTDAETAHQQFSCFFQHVPNFAFSFLYQLLICLIEYKNIYFLFLQKGNAGNLLLTVSLLSTTQNPFGFKIPSKRNRKKVPTPPCPESEVINKFKNRKRVLGPKFWEMLLQTGLCWPPRGQQFHKIQDLYLLMAGTTASIYIKVHFFKTGQATSLQ